jgi:hypothetical protein
VNPEHILERKQINKYVIFTAGLIIIIALAVISYTIGSAPGPFSLQSKEEGDYIFDRDCDNVILQGLIYESGRDTIRIYNLKNNRQIGEIPQTLNRAVMKVLNEELIIYEYRGRGIIKVDRTKVSRESNIDEGGEIYDIVEVNENLLGVIYKRDRYKSSLLLLDRAFNSIFERAYSDAFVTEAKFIKRDQILILLNSFIGEEIRVYYEVIDINTGEIIKEKTLGANVFHSVFSLKGDKVMIASGNELIMINDQCDIEFRKVYDDSSIYDIDTAGGRIIILKGMAKDGQEHPMKATGIEIADQTGTIEHSFAVDPGISKVMYIDKKVKGLSNDGVYTYSIDGEFLYKTGSDDIIEKIAEYKGDFYFFFSKRVEKASP